MIAADPGYRDRDDHTTTVDAAAASAAYAARDADAHMAERAEAARVPMAAAQPAGTEASLRRRPRCPHAGIRCR